MPASGRGPFTTAMMSIGRVEDRRIDSIARCNNAARGPAAVVAMIVVTSAFSLAQSWPEDGAASFMGVDTLLSGEVPRSVLFRSAAEGDTVSVAHIHRRRSKASKL